MELYLRLSKDGNHIYDPCIAAIYNGLGNIYMSYQSYTESEQMYLESLIIRRRLFKENFMIYKFDFEVTLYSLSLLYDMTDEHDKQYDIYEEFIPLLKCDYQDNGDVYKTDYSTTLGNHSFCCIFMQEFSKAEQYAREGIEVDPTQTFIYSNLASSLLFQGKYNDAEIIYKQYKTELKDSFLSDFEEFEEAGIIPSKYKSDVEKIKQLLNE